MILKSDYTVCTNARPGDVYSKVQEIQFLNYPSFSPSFLTVFGMFHCAIFVRKNNIDGMNFIKVHYMQVKISQWKPFVQLIYANKKI
jgi:hypothetical protein